MKNKLSITQAAKICGYQRTYFYKIIDKYNISIKKDSANRSYIDPSELVRSVPGDMINNELLAVYAEIQTLTDDTIIQKTTQQDTSNNEVVELLKQQVKHLSEQLEISQKQVFSLLDTVNKQTLLLEHKPTHTDDTIRQKTTQEYKPLIDELRKQSKKKKKKGK
jgi:hypothetical protein